MLYCQNSQRKGASYFRKMKFKNLTIDLEVKNIQGQSDKGRFQFLERVGEGGFSQVWKAIDLDTEQIKAIKVFKPNGYLQGFARNLQYFAAFQDRFGLAICPEAVEMLLYNEKFLSIINRKLGERQPDLIQSEGYAWIPQMRSFCLILPFRNLRKPHLRLHTFMATKETDEYPEQFSIMRDLSQVWCEGGAGNLVPQIAISEDSPPKESWFSLTNLLRDLQTNRLVLVDSVRNVVSLWGYVFPFFYFKAFGKVSAYSSKLNTPPDRFHMMDMERFEIFTKKNTSLLTEEESSQIKEWIQDYQALSKSFVSRVPWLFRKSSNDWHLFSKIRTNNIADWLLLGEITEKKASALKNSFFYYMLFLSFRFLKLFLKISYKVFLKCLLLIKNVALFPWNFLVSALRWASSALRFVFDKRYRNKIADDFFFHDVDTAFERNLITHKQKEEIHHIYTDYKAFPRYAQLYALHLLPKFPVWIAQLFGLGKGLLGGGWMFFVGALFFPLFYRSLFTTIMMLRYRDVDFKRAFWVGLIPKAGGYLAVPFQMLVVSEEIKPWYILKTRLAAMWLSKKTIGFGEPGGLLHYYIDHFLVDPFLNLSFKFKKRPAISEKDFEIPEKLKVPRISETALSQKEPALPEKKP